MKDLTHSIIILDDNLKVAMHVLDMFLWICKTIIVFQSYLCGDVLLGDKGVQDLSR